MVPTEDELLESSEAPDHSPEQIYMEREVRQKLDARCRSLKEPYGEVARMYFCEDDIVNNGWHIYLKDICTYATLSKVS